MYGKPRRDGAMCLRRTGRFDPFAGTAVYPRLGNAHGLRDFVRFGVRFGTTDLTRQTIIAGIFEAALDAPFGDPHLKMHLKAR